MGNIQLSVVAGSRNDDHGENLLYRMQHFAIGFINQCKKHQLRAELILVEWNPPEDKRMLSEVLDLPKDKGPCEVRIITVPKEIHETLAYSQELPMFQMIAKNVGIRRARGQYVLATNIDILFSDELIQFMRDQLQPGYVYRTDRLDIPSEVLSISDINPILSYCKQSYFRIHGRYGTKTLNKGKWSFIDSSHSEFNQKLSCLKKSLWSFWLRKILLFLCITGRKKVNLIQFVRRVQLRFKVNIHTNACGDFTLLSYDDWCFLKGYPELEGFSWHLDALFLYQAALSGIQKKELSKEKTIYHIEHAKGSGYTPENQNLVFNRIKAKGIPYLTTKNLQQKVIHMIKSTKKKKPFIYNKKDWGFANCQFQDSIL